MEASGEKTTLVPLRSEDLPIGGSLTKIPFSNSATLHSPSRKDCTLKKSESAFTALVPTPFSPTDFWNAPESYLPPVLILETQSITFPSGIPRP